MSESTPDATETVAAPVEPDSQADNSGNTADHVETANERGEIQTGADDTSSSSSDDTSTSTTDDASQFDDDLDKWAEKRGYGELETEKERRIAQDARNNQRNFHKERGGEQLNNQVTEAFTVEETDDADADFRNTVLNRQNVLEAQLRTRDFFDSRPEAKELEPKMVELLKDEQDKYGPDAARFLGRDLDRLYTLAKATSSSTDTADAVEQARREERESLAKKQRASTVDGAATTTEAPKKTDGADAIRAMDVSEYRNKLRTGWNPIRDA